MPPGADAAARCELFAEEDVVAQLAGSGLAHALDRDIPVAEIHPFAAMAVGITPPPGGDPPDVVYVYTDGSFPLSLIHI